MEQRIVTIIGGTGFLGRYVVKLLADSGYTLRVVSRHPELALHLKTAGDVGQVVLVAGNMAKPESLASSIAGSYAVINLAGILFEGGRQRFTAIHAQGAERLAQMATACGVARFVHVSALAVDKAGGSHYARSKALGEKAVMAAFARATVLRPSVMFGAEDNFFNKFADMAEKSPALPLIGGGKTKFQPVYVGDVAEAIAACLARDDTPGKTYELGGPQVFTFREILEYILRTIDRKRCLLNLPFGLAGLLGMGMELLPKPPLTRDQVKLLAYDNVLSPGSLGFAQLGITPTPVELVVPEYLARFHKKVLTKIGTLYD